MGNRENLHPTVLETAGKGGKLCYNELVSDKMLRKDDIMRRFLALFLLCLLPLSALADQTITLTFTGDVTLGSEERTRPEETSFDSVYAREGEAYFLKNMAEFFAQDDLTIVNLEGVISDSNAFEVTNKAYRFRAPTQMTGVLTSSSVEVCSMANNHSYDFGRQGYAKTQEALTAAGLHYFGDKNVYVYEKGNVKIAFLSLNTTEFYGSRAWFREEIARLKGEEGVKAVVFCFHVGSEYAARHIPRQEQYAQNAIDAGADLIIMHHPHVAQGMEIYKNRHIFYSLGNFCFGGNSKVEVERYGKYYSAREALVVRAELTFADDGTYLGQQMRLYPVYTSGQWPENNYQPLMADEAGVKVVMDRIQFDTKWEIPAYDPEKGYAETEYLAAE